MLIPVKCFTCGKVLGDKYRWYLGEVQKRKAGAPDDRVIYLTKEHMDKTIEGQILDELKLNKYCCRRHMLTHVDIE